MDKVTENSTVKIRTLIVEDEPPTARFVRSLVEREPEFEVAEMCESAEEAVRVIEENPELGLIITDIRLAEMSGLELLKKVRQADREIRLIIISGYKMFEYAREAIRLNIEDYVTKPIDPGEFHRVLRKVSGYYEEEMLLKEQNFLEKALRAKDGAKAAQILKKRPAGILAVYRSGDPDEMLTGREEDRRVFLTVQYKECFLFFGGTEKDRRKQEMFIRKNTDSGTLLVAGLSEFPADEECAGAVRHLYYQMQKMTVPGKQKSVFRKSLEELADVGETAPVVPDSVPMYIRTERWGLLKKTFRKMFREWEAREPSLYGIRMGLRMIGEELGKSSAVKPAMGMYNEETEYILRYAETFPEIEEGLLALFEEILPHASMNSGVEEKEEKLVQSIIALTDKNMDKNYSLAEISEFYRVSQPYIRKLFKKYTKNSYNKYLMERKIKYAESMIEANPDILIKDIADALGFEQFYFSTVFSRNTGMTPSEYKSRMKGGMKDEDHQSADEPYKTSSGIPV